MADDEIYIQRALENILDSEKRAAEIGARMKKRYKTVAKGIDSEINRFYARYAIDQHLTLEDARKHLTMPELKAFKQEVKEYYEEAKAENWDDHYINELMAIYGSIAIMRQTTLTTGIKHTLQRAYQYEHTLINTGLKTQFNSSFYSSMFNLQTKIGVGVVFNAPSDAVINRAMNAKWEGSNFSARIWKDRNKLVEVLNRELPGAFVLGENPIKAARRIRDAVELRFSERIRTDSAGNQRRIQSNCERLARTELNHMANQASREATAELSNAYGGNLFDKYRYEATLDGKTSEICQALDGMVFLLSEEQVGVNSPPMHPNCRSTRLTITDTLEIQERIARDPFEKSYYIPRDITYKEWFASLTDSDKLLYKIANNRNADLAQLNKYRERLGRKGLPRSVAEFQRIKYYDANRYNELKNQYRKAS